MTDVRKRIALGDVLRAETKAARLKKVYDKQSKEEVLISEKEIKGVLDDFDITTLVADKDFDLECSTVFASVPVNNALIHCFFYSSILGKLSKKQEVIVELRFWRVLQNTYLKYHTAEDLRQLSVWSWFLRTCDEASKAYESMMHYTAK